MIDTICMGSIRQSSVDSIIQLTRHIQDTLTYETNAGIMSGVIQSLTIETDTMKRRFVLHNASHPVAAKIIAILNSNLPADKEKMWVFHTQ